LSRFVLQSDNLLGCLFVLFFGSCCVVCLSAIVHLCCGWPQNASAVLYNKRVASPIKGSFNYFLFHARQAKDFSEVGASDGIPI
jgi:hypothetical protein